MVITLEEESECLFGRVHSNLEILWLSNNLLPLLCVNFLDLEHGGKGNNSAYE